MIIAKMVTINGKNRFKNKLILDVSVNKAVRDPQSIINQAEELIAKSS